MHELNLQDEVRMRLTDVTNGKYYGLIPNLFAEYDDDKLYWCIRNYYASLRGIGFGSPSTEAIKEYIKLLDSLFPNEERKVIEHAAIEIMIADLHREALDRYFEKYVETHIVPLRERL